MERKIGFQLKIIQNDSEYELALKTIKENLDKGVVKNSEQENFIEVLSLLIENYEEERNYKMDISKVDAIGVMEYFMEENGLQQKDLVPLLGPSSRVSEIMNRKRRLSLKQIQRLHQEFKIPYELLMKKRNIEELV